MQFNSVTLVPPLLSWVIVNIFFYFLGNHGSLRTRERLGEARCRAFSGRTRCLTWTIEGKIFTHFLHSGGKKRIGHSLLVQHLTNSLSSPEGREFETCMHFSVELSTSSLTLKVFDLQVISNFYLLELHLDILKS